MTVEQLIVLLSNIKDKTKLVTIPNEMLIAAVDEYSDYIVITDGQDIDPIPEIIH